MDIPLVELLSRLRHCSVAKYGQEPLKASKREAPLETRFPLRTVEDDHVDRPDVEAQQCVKLTGTNCSIGLIVLIFSICEPMSTRYLTYLSFAGLVTMAKCLNPIPSRTRSLNTSALMVLHLKVWESRSLPGLLKTNNQHSNILLLFFAIVFLWDLFQIC